jgi:hypothetical protein
VARRKRSWPRRERLDCGYRRLQLGIYDVDDRLCPVGCGVQGKWGETSLPLRAVAYHVVAYPCFCSRRIRIPLKKHEEDSTAGSSFRVRLTDDGIASLVM